MSFNNKLYDSSLDKPDDGFSALQSENGYSMLQPEPKTRKTTNEQSYRGYTKTSTVYLIVGVVVIVAVLLSAGSGILVYLIMNGERVCKCVIPEQHYSTKTNGPDLTKTTMHENTTKTNHVHAQPTTETTITESTPTEADMAKPTTRIMISSTTTTKPRTTVITTQNRLTPKTTWQVSSTESRTTTSTKLTTVSAGRRNVTDGIATTITNTELQCPPEWLTFDSGCYYFSKLSKKWTDAMRACHAVGGILVEIYDVTEDTFLRRKAMDFRSDFWMGLTDLREEGVWAWNGSGTIVTDGIYTNWAPRQPDDGSRSEDCALIEKLYSYLWNDDQCYNVHKYICEKSIT